MTIRRSFDLVDFVTALYPYCEELVGFDPEEWLNNQLNIAITDEEGNYALFEYNSYGVYTGHYFFKVRGKKAKILAIEILAHVFSTCDVQLVRGIVPLTKLGSRWMSRQIGFKSYGIVGSEVGPCELFIQTKEEWKDKV